MEEFRFAIAMLSILWMLKQYMVSHPHRRVLELICTSKMYLKTAMNASRTNTRKMTFTTLEITIFYTETLTRNIDICCLFSQVKKIGSTLINFSSQNFNIECNFFLTWFGLHFSTLCRKKNNNFANKKPQYNIEYCYFPKSSNYIIWLILYSRASSVTAQENKYKF